MRDPLFRSFVQNAEREVPTFLRWRRLLLGLYGAYVAWVVWAHLHRRDELEGSDAFIATCSPITLWIVITFVCVAPVVMFDLTIWFTGTRRSRQP